MKASVLQNTGNQQYGWKDIQGIFDNRFGLDLNLVNHPDESKLTFDLEPWPVGRYSLTTLNGRNEKYLFEKVGGRKVAIVVGCMDKRYARSLYEFVLSKSKGQFVLPLFMAGGIAQGKHPVRSIALGQTLTWMCEHLDVSKIWVSGHTHNCGGLSYIHHYGKKTVCQGLSCKPGSMKEEKFVKGQISDGVRLCVPNTHWGRTQKVLVTEKRDRPVMQPFR